MSIFMFSGNRMLGDEVQGEHEVVVGHPSSLEILKGLLSIKDKIRVLYGEWHY